MKEKLSKKEKEFCRYYAAVRNAREAAALSGYSAFPQKNGMRLLHKTAVREEINAISKQNRNFKQEAAAGFRRLAFGSVADAVKLLRDEEGEIESMDLFMISDIKLPKTGGMEIKFFDRQKALEALASLENADTENTALPFYKALEKSASFLNDCKDDENELF